MGEKLVITGIGAVTPLGIGVDATWEALTRGKCGIKEIERFDTANLTVKRAGQVPAFNPKDYLPTKLALDLEPFMQYAYMAAEEAIRMAQLDTHSNRIGVVMGTALSGISIIGETAAAYEKGKSASPKLLTKCMGNIAAAQLAINHGLQGPSMTVTTACSSGGDALSLAAMFIECGAADAMVVMSGEAATCPTMIQSLTKTGALSKLGESRPFDVDRSGFVIGEGGGAMILERESFAKERGAGILADLCGYANTNDAFNPVSPNPEGLGIASCMELALQKAGLEPREIGYINAHGTATHQGDIAECTAIRSVFGNHPLFVSSTKGMTGHMMGAGGLVEAIFCLLAITKTRLPVNIGMSQQDPDCPVQLVSEANCQRTIDYALSDSMGFGGQNSCVIIGRHKETV